MPTKQEIAFRARVGEILKNIENLQTEEVRNMLVLLDRARERTILNLQSLGLSEWKANHLQQLKSAADRAIFGFGQQFRSSLDAQMVELWEVGQSAVDIPLRTMNVGFAVPEINLTSLTLAQSGLSDLVGNGLVPELVKRVNTEITLGILGEKSPFEIMQAIGKDLKSPGPFGTIATRAETITRTELSRVQNLASHLRIDQIGQQVEGLEHQWLWSGNLIGGRPGHASIHGQIKKFNERFITGKGNALLHPHDPNAPPDEVINCGCTEAPHMEGWPDITDLNTQLSDDAEVVTMRAAFVSFCSHQYFRG